MKELKSIKVYTPLSKYLAWFVFFGGANICLIGALFYNYIFGRVRNPLSLIGLIVFFTIFTAIQVAIKYLFGRKLLIEGQDIRAKKWYGKWHKFVLSDVDRIFIRMEGKTAISVKIYAGEFCDQYERDMEDFERMLNYLKKNLDAEQIFSNQDEKVYIENVMKSVKKKIVMVATEIYLDLQVLLGVCSLFLVIYIIKILYMGAKSSPISLLGLIALLTLFIIFDLICYYLAGQKLILEGNNFVARKWFFKKYYFSKDDIDRIYLKYHREKISSFKLCAGNFQDVYGKHMNNFNSMLNYLEKNLDKEKITLLRKE